MKAKEIRTLSEKDFEIKIEELKKELIKLRAQSTSGATMENPGKIKSIKRTIAKMNTIKKELGGKAKK